MTNWFSIPAQAGGAATFVVLGSVSVMLVSLAKAGFGGSLGLLSVPILIFACGGDATLATGIMLPLLIACDYVSLVIWWRRWSLRPVALLLPGAVAGVAIGGVTLWGVARLGAASRKADANAVLVGLIGLIALGFVALQAVRALRKRNGTYHPTWPQAAGLGTLAGFTSTLAHAAGPVVSMYLLPQRLPKQRYVASTVLFYWIGNQIKLVPYLALGMIDAPSMHGSVVLLPAVLAGAVLGVVLHKRLGERQFSLVVYALLALAGIQLCIESLHILLR